MTNSFTYYPADKIYHIHLGELGDLGNTIVCQEGFDIACSYDVTWSAGLGYAIAFFKNNPLRLSRVILNAPNYFLVDHINGIKLDNRKVNLQLVTDSQNMAKSKLRKDNSSGYRGVTLDRARKKWMAEIGVNGKRIRLGLHLTKEDAALAYNEASLKHFGKYAYQNLIKNNLA